MKDNPCRLYIFTGKGGVGKTTLSKSFVKYLNEHDHEAVYVTFKNQSISDELHQSTVTFKDGIKEIFLDLAECAQNYIEKKLNSKLIASWIVKTPFFRALINMVPGFNYLIYLGKILEMGHENPRLIIILDAPASGHALTMIESTTNFQQIFESGIIFEDTSKMLSKLNDPDYTKIHIISLASNMSWQEAIELKSGLKNRIPVEVNISLNNTLYPQLKNHLNELPEVLKQKALNEKELIEKNHKEMLCVLDHSMSKSQAFIEQDLIKTMNQFL